MSSRHDVPRSLLAGLCALLVAWAALGVTSRAANAVTGVPLQGMFSITPARSYDVGRPPATLSPTTVSNTTGGTLSVTAVPVLLTQERSGAFAFTSSSGRPRRATHLLTVRPARFSLPPGTSQRVTLVWRDMRPHRRTVSIGVIYAAVPSSSAGPVKVVERLLGVDILRLPGHYRASGALAGVHVTQAPKGMLRLALAARNTGDIAITPRELTLAVRSSDGARVLSERLRPDVVLPNATREFATDLKRELPPGAYVAAAHMSLSGGRTSTVSVPFDVARKGRLPSADPVVGVVHASGQVGEQAEVTASVRNAGTAEGFQSIHLRLYRLSDGLPSREPVATRTLRSGRLVAGRRKELRAGLGRLRPGAYRLLASYEDSSHRRRTVIADFEALQPVGMLDRLRQISREHSLLIPGLLIVALCGLAVVMLLRERRAAIALAAARKEIATLAGSWMGQGTA